MGQTALDFIKTALRRCVAYQSGETIAPYDQNDCLEVFNDLLDSMSTDKQMVFGSNQNIFNWNVNQTVYKIGNPLCTDLGESPFTGTVTSGSPTITGVTSIPSDLAAGTSYNTNGAGSTILSLQSLFPANTYVTAFSVAGQTVTVNANATGNSQGQDTLTYSIPGDFPIPRPLRITNGFTRINQLDFTLEVYESQDRFLEILYKAQPGPWPTVAWYNNVFPYGILNVYQAPGQASQVYLYTDTILANLTIDQVIVMPQGYARALKWLLTREIWCEYNGASSIPPMVDKMSSEALSFLKALNAQPAVVSKYDRELVRGNRPDGGWITHGGFR